MSYYYLVSSMPELKMGEPPSMSLEQFRFRCQGVLEESDLNDLDRVLVSDTDAVKSPPAAHWLAADTQLRNAVAQIRAAQLNIDSNPYLRDHQGARVFIETAVRDAFTKLNPLERELALDKCRWFILDELAAEDRFGLGAVIAFAVKLQILERWAGYSETKGREELEKFIFDNLETQGFPAIVEASE